MFDPCPDVEWVVVFLGLFIGIERLPVAERPLTLALLAARTAAARCAGGPARRGVVVSVAVSVVIGFLVSKQHRRSGGLAGRCQAGRLRGPVDQAAWK